jgi:hypothetical protein
MAMMMMTLDGDHDYDERWLRWTAMTLSGDYHGRWLRRTMTMIATDNDGDCNEWRQWQLQRETTIMMDGNNDGAGRQLWRTTTALDNDCVATLALARDQGKGVARLRAYK